MLTVARQGFPYERYILDDYGFTDKNNAMVFYSPTQIQGSLSYMVRPEGCATTVDSAYLASERCSPFKMLDGCNISTGELDYSQRNVGGIVPFESYPLGLENFPTLGGPMVQAGIQLPVYTPPLPPRRQLVPQAKYGDKGNSKRGFNREPPITFDVGDQNGMSLQDAMDEKYSGLVGRDDGMFVGCGCTAISLRIQVCKFLQGVRFFHPLFGFLSQWPGCEPWTRHVCVYPLTW